MATDDKVLVGNMPLANLTVILQSQLGIKEMDYFFVLTMACIIFFMQCGFAFLEAGSVRSKNTTNILMKNMLDAFIGGIGYWSLGYAFAFGSGNSFIGYQYFFSINMPEANYHMWFFHFVFAATAATIVSGAMAERCDIAAYFTYSFCITAIVYPIVTHWAWSEEGWLNIGNGAGINYQDFAGSGVVHLLGGTAALIGAAVLQPRIGRFDKLTGKPQNIVGHSIPLVALGGFILTFGFFAFNGGSEANISKPGDGIAIARSIMNTVLSGSFAAFSALIATKLGICCKHKCDLQTVGERPWSLLTTINAALTGMVAICAGCNVYYPWGAAVIGTLAGLIFIGARKLVILLKIDDPLDAVAVHGFGGFFGVLCQPILKMETGIVFTGDKDAFLHLAWNVAGIAAIMGWTTLICLPMFLILKALKVLRVDEEWEIRGLDIPKHGEAAYPAQAYGDGWAEVRKYDNISCENRRVSLHVKALNLQAYRDRVAELQQVPMDNLAYEIDEIPGENGNLHKQYEDLEADTAIKSQTDLHPVVGGRNSIHVPQDGTEMTANNKPKVNFEDNNSKTKENEVPKVNFSENTNDNDKEVNFDAKF